MNHKILLTAILKDDSEYDLAKRMLDSFMPHMAGLAVAITGLSGKHKKLEKLIKKHGGRYIFTTPTQNHDIYARDKDGKWFFANFAAARNASFALAQQMQADEKYDWWTWADVDDLLFHGEELQKAADQADALKLDSVFFTYWYSVQIDEQGNITNVAIEHLRERLLRPGLWKWISRLHEVCIAKDDNFKPRNSDYRFSPDESRRCVWAHVPPPDRVYANLYRNVDILKVQLEEEHGNDPRTIFYLAKTDIDIAKTENKPELLVEAEGLLKKYLEMSGWDEERANAWEYLGNIYDAQNKHHEALEVYHKGLAEHPVHHLLYLRLVKKYMDLQQWEKAEWWLDMILRADGPQTRTTIGNPLEIQVTAAALKYNMALAKQDLNEALKWYRKRNKLLQAPADDDYTKTLENLLELNNAAMWIYNYAVWLKRHNHTAQLEAVLDTIAPEMKKEQFVQVIANQVLEPKTWSDKSIVYYAGQSFEDWSDQSLARGLGGSETAIVELSRAWAKQGYEVTVFCNCGDEEGVREGVTYRHFATVNWNDTFNIFIAWRNPGVLDLDIKAKRIFYDAHDIESNLNWTVERVNRLCKAFFKSAWHRSNVPNIPDEKSVVIHNGIQI